MGQCSKVMDDRTQSYTFDQNMIKYADEKYDLKIYIYKKSSLVKTLLC